MPPSRQFDPETGDYSVIIQNIVRHEYEIVGLDARFVERCPSIEDRPRTFVPGPAWIEIRAGRFVRRVRRVLCAVPVLRARAGELFRGAGAFVPTRAGYARVGREIAGARVKIERHTCPFVEGAGDLDGASLANERCRDLFDGPVRIHPASCPVVRLARDYFERLPAP